MTRADLMAGDRPWQVRWGLDGWRPRIYLVGGRRPLSTSEWREWLAHTELCNAEAEHARRAGR